MSKKTTAKQVAILFLLFTASFTLFRSSMSGIFSLFYAKRGISPASISSIKSFQNIGIMVGLLPSGYLSDRVGRLKVLNLSAIVISGSFLFLIFFKSALFFSLAEFFYGIGLALNSGTLIAYVTDLQEKNKIEPDKKLMGMQVIVLNLTTLLGGNIGTWLFNINDFAPVWFSVIGLAAYPIFVFLLTKYMRFSDNKAVKYRKEPILASFKKFLVFFKKKSFWILLLLNVGYDCGTQFILVYWSIIYVEKLQFNLSLVYTLFMCATLLGSALFNKIATLITSRLLIGISTCWMIIMLLFSGIMTNRNLLLILFLLIELLMGIMSGQINSASSIEIYGESNKSMLLSTVSFTSEIIVSITLFLNSNIMQLADSMRIMFFVSVIYFSIMLLAIPLLKKND